MIDLDDPRAGKVAEVIANMTCKKILALLAEKEMSGSEIAEELKIPLNTVGYNIKKLIEIGLIEKINKFFWSAKGKRIYSYKLSNKRIVISPRSKLPRGVLPATVIAVLSTVAIFVLQGINKTGQIASREELKTFESVGNDAVASGAGLAQPAATDAAPEVSGNALENILQWLIHGPNSWAWFFIGAFLVLVVIILINWRKK